DEPTNDLDLETLELLEAQLVDWIGTLLLVSHDRIFLDNVVTSTMCCEGAVEGAEYVGGYADWLRQRPAPRSAKDIIDAGSGRRTSNRPAGVVQRAAVDQTSASTRRKLTYNEQREL